MWIRASVSAGIALFFVSLAASFAGPPAYAVLGGDVASIQQDAQGSGHAVEVTTSHHAGYNRYEIAPNGFRLREFAGAGGKIFALAWSGRRHPDLRSLLGEHFKDFQAALADARREHRRGGAIVVDTGDLHLEIGGHMSALYGKVWLKNQVPDGMDLNEIR